MAQIEEKSLLNELDKGKLRSCYFLVGADPARADFFLNAILQIIRKDGVCTPEKFYADETKLPAFSDAFQNAPLWLGKRLVVLKRLEKWPTKEQEQFLALLQQQEWNEQAYLVVMTDKIDGRTKFAQELSKQSFVTQLAFPALGPDELAYWLHHLAQARGLKISPAAKAIFMESGIASVAEVDQALGTVALYVEGKPVEPEHLQKVHWVSAPESVFELTDAVLARQYRRAAETLLLLERQGEEPLPLLALLARQFRLMFQITALRQGGKSDQAIASEMRLYPRQAKSILQGASQRPPAKIIKGLESLAQADLALKSTREPHFQVLQRLLTDIT